MYQGVLEFKGQWRTYQARVLKNMRPYMADQKIHIVAAPGSGKTTLGIELIRRMDKKALVLAPSITIREQWAARIEEAFLCDGLAAEDYISQNLKTPRAITIATYQALHSAMTQYKGIQKEENEETEDTGDNVIEEAGPEGLKRGEEQVDFSSFDVVSALRAEGVGVLCLDECHHLRSEWWKALTDMRKEMPDLKGISLTATPPYDDTPAMWTRYMDMCGEIDEEITIPELVKEGSLCPHQDYVYFNYPTGEEAKEIKAYEERASGMMSALMSDPEFARVIQTHPILRGACDVEKLLDKPSYLSSMLIFFNSKKIAFPTNLQRLLGAKNLPEMEEKWMEILLQGFLYEDADSYICDNVYREELLHKLKANGLIEKKKITFTSNEKIEKMLTNSKGKCDSIRDITFSEYQSLGRELRLLILTDYIRKAYESSVGDLQKDVNNLGVIPFFEMLRRENESRNEKIRFGVLCGTVVIIPAEARESLEENIRGSGTVHYSPVGALNEEEYVKVTPVGDGHFLTAAVTKIFTEGFMQVLIGTKSLLGEGWDAPCVNSLILASFVGSFMLSNQMRGRSIRVWNQYPEKTSNIWHLVCLRPWKEVLKDGGEQISRDFSLLERRMEHFMGLHTDEDTIENGMDRLTMIRPPFNESNVRKINKKMLEMSGERSTLRERWKKSLAIYSKMEIAEETEVQDRLVALAAFYDAIWSTVLNALILILFFSTFIFTKGSGMAALGSALAFIYMIVRLPKVFMLGSPLKRLKVFGQGIQKAMLQQGHMESANTKVVTKSCGSDLHLIYLKGGSGKEKALFAQCVAEFMGVVDNQRYLIVKEKGLKGMDAYYCVPDCFSKRKEDAAGFASCMRPYIGKNTLVYTRNEAGRKVLLDARIRAFSNRQNRCCTKKRVKSALE